MCNEVGVKGGLCQRTACRAPGADRWHTGRKEYYCGVCARQINEACRRDALRLYGVEWIIVNPATLTAEERAMYAAKGVNVPEA